MIEERRRAYLQALGVDVWLRRPPGPEPGCVGVGRGRDSTLLLCLSADQCRTDLARDVERALGGDPLWAWLDPSAEEESQILQEVVAERLITRILVFGPETARRAFAGEVPAILGSATILALPGLPELAASGAARQALWKQLRVPHAAPRDWS